MISILSSGRFSTIPNGPTNLDNLRISYFEFIYRYFFYVLLILIGIGFLNGLLFFPMLLLLIGPPAEVRPLKYPDRMCTPSPEPIKKPRRSSSCRQAPPPPPRRHREPSLSTITEEPGSWHSTTHEIVVEPELVVETTTFTRPQPPVSIHLAIASGMKYIFDAN